MIKPVKWRSIGVGGSQFRATRNDGRKADVLYEIDGTWIVYVEWKPSPHAGPGPQARVGAFDTRGKAKRAALAWEAP